MRGIPQRVCAARCPQVSRAHCGLHSHVVTAALKDLLCGQSDMSPGPWLLGPWGPDTAECLRLPQENVGNAADMRLTCVGDNGAYVCCTCVIVIVVVWPGVSWPVVCVGMFSFGPVWAAVCAQMCHMTVLCGGQRGALSVTSTILNCNFYIRENMHFTCQFVTCTYMNSVRANIRHS